MVHFDPTPPNAMQKDNYITTLPIYVPYLNMMSPDGHYTSHHITPDQIMLPYLHRSQVWKWRTSQRPYLEQQHAVAPHITASTELLVKEALCRGGTKHRRTQRLCMGLQQVKNCKMCALHTLRIMPTSGAVHLMGTFPPMDM